MTVEEAGSPNRREECSNAGCLALLSGEEVTNTTINSTATETATNGTSWTLPDTLDPRELLTTAETTMMDKLTAWGYDPAHALFLFVLVLVLAFAFNYLTSGATAKMQGGNKYLLFIIVFLGILWFIGAI